MTIISLYTKLRASVMFNSVTTQKINIICKKWAFQSIAKHYNKDVGEHNMSACIDLCIMNLNNSL